MSMDMKSYLEATRQASTTLILAYTRAWLEHKEAALVYNRQIDRLENVEKDHKESLANEDHVDEAARLAGFAIDLTREGAFRDDEAA